MILIGFHRKYNFSKKNPDEHRKECAWPGNGVHATDQSGEEKWKPRRSGGIVQEIHRDSR